MADIPTSSVPTTPVSFVPSNLFFESNLNSLNSHEDENTWDIGQMGSPGSKRCPTFKDYAEKIKHLQQENFQLRVRVFLCEQKTGVKTSSSDFAVLFQQNMQQLQNAFNANNANNNMTHSSSSNDGLSSQLGTLKSQNEHLNTKVVELEQKVHNYEMALIQKQRENDRLVERNEEMLGRIEDLETEYTLTRMKLQQQNNQPIRQNTAINDDEVERGARIAFGQFDEDVDECKRELEAKLMAESSKVHELQKRLNKMQKDVDKSINNISTLERQKKESDTKLVECSKALMEFGKRNMYLSKEIEELKLDQERQRNDLNASKACDSIIQERYSSVREVVCLLQGRIFDIISFIETLLSLESKKVFTLTGLTDQNRRNLRDSVEHCQMLSRSLDQLFGTGDDTDLSSRKMACMSLLHKDSTFNYASFDRRDLGDKIPVKKSSIGVQCEREDKASVKVQKDLQKSEQIRQRLILEQSYLTDRVALLEASLKTAHDQVDSLEKSTRMLSNHTMGALQSENNALVDRLTVSETALRRLHNEHAKLVAELKVMRSIQLEPTNKDKLSCSYSESERPSDTTSPDLGIDSGHDGAGNSDDSSNSNYKAKNRELRKNNIELAQKLRQTKQALDKTLEKLHSTTKQKEQVEKAICRQLHKTHTILRQAKKSVEKFTANQAASQNQESNNNIESSSMDACKSTQEESPPTETSRSRFIVSERVDPIYRGLV